jgi:sec-independent protein translocase protein TatB
VFGFSFGELVVLLIVAVIVIGPKDLPKVLRRLGQWAAKMRRMASDIRAQSGIDDVLRNEGIADDIAEIRRLARGELDSVAQAAKVDIPRIDLQGTVPAARKDPYAGVTAPADVPIVREREYPREGADAYRGLPDTAIVFATTQVPTKLARDPLYVTGDPAGVLPDPPDASSPSASPAP